MPMLVLISATLAVPSSMGEEIFRQKRSTGDTPGKRITSNLVTELGKRPRELFSFGIGKRSISAKEMAEFLAEQEGNHQNHEEAGESAVMSHDASSVASGDSDLLNAPIHLGPRPGQGAQDIGLGKREYGFGLGRKRDPYAFGLGKRDPYSFGLGKRDPYAFGLGKRDPYAFGLGKRDPYSFGLGKRDPYSFGLGKRDPYSFGLGKRDPYSFGLGK